MNTGHDLARIAVSFDEQHLVPHAGLLPAALLAQRIDLAGLVDQRLHLPIEAANSGTKALTVIGSMLAGGDSIDDTDLMRAGASSELFDQVRAPTTIGCWLRAFKWHNVRELDAVSRELLARLWAAGAGPADPNGALTFDLDSTIVQVYGRGKQGADYGYTKVRGHHPQLATLAETRQVIFSRMRGGEGQRGPQGQVLPDRNGQPTAPRRGHRSAHRSCRQRVLLTRNDLYRAQAWRAVLHHRPPGPQDPSRDRRHSGGGLATNPVLVVHPRGLGR